MPAPGRRPTGAPSGGRAGPCRARGHCRENRRAGLSRYGSGVRTLVVLPTYQEAANVAGVLERLRTAVPDATILVVDDSSPDGTADVAETAAKELGNIEVLRRPVKDGLGSAYRAGFVHGLELGFDAMVEIDADGSHDPAALPSLLAALNDGA